MPTKQHMTFYDSFEPKTLTEYLDGKEVLYVEYNTMGFVTLLRERKGHFFLTYNVSYDASNQFNIDSTIRRLIQPDE